MSTANYIGTQKVGLSGTSVAPGGANAVFGMRLWGWPIVAAIVLGAVGWYTNRVIEAALHKQMADRLATTLNADVEAVGIWITEQQVDAELIAAAGPVLSLSRELIALEEAKESVLLQASQQAALRAYLNPRLKGYGYTDYFLVTRSLRIVASDEDAAIGRSMDGFRADFCKRVLLGQSAVSKPFRSAFALSDASGETRAGLPTIFAAAPVRNPEGGVVAVMAIRIPVAHFTRILRMAQSGETGDTYAFDAKGLLLSESRFDDDLRRVGILADTADVRSILTLELRDPQVNMMAGERPTLPRAERPLTRMAADAVQGGSGIDVVGYRDYRGVPVVGAWKWLKEYDFGVATEMSVAEAYEPLHMVRNAFLGLFALAALGAVAIFVFLIVVARQQKRVEKAENLVKQLGQYTIEEKIGSGGMGSVYRARHAYLRRPTAVKMLNVEHVTGEALARFEREVQLTAQLNHPNTIAIYDYGRSSDGVFYYAMEYLEGVDLEALVKEFGPLPEGRTIAILKQVCASLTEAHAAGLIHRDIKPANIILTNRAGIPDFVKVLDFGLAKALSTEDAGKLTAANVSLGTPQYMAPEAIERPESLTISADIYSIGALGYYLLTGTPVFSGKTVMEICMKHVRATPDPVSKRLGRAIDVTLEAIILRCLAKSPAERFPSTEALIDELGRCESSQGWTRAEAIAWWSAYRKQHPSAGPATATAAQTVEL